jgi:uncharacterized protein YkwD
MSFWHKILAQLSDALPIKIWFWRFTGIAAAMALVSVVQAERGPAEAQVFGNGIGPGASEFGLSTNSAPVDLVSASAYGNWAFGVLSTPPPGLGFLALTETALLVRLNDVRVQFGLSRINGSNELQKVARAHAVDMIERGFFDHVNPEGRGPGDRVGIIDRQFVGTTGENIARMGGSISKNENPLAAQFHQNWMESEGHRENILTEDWSAVGIGVAYREGNVVAVQLFGNEMVRLLRPAPTLVRRGQRLDLASAGIGAPAQLFDLWDPVRMVAIGRPLQISSGTIGAPVGTYNLRFYFPEGFTGFRIFNGPLLSVQ